MSCVFSVVPFLHTKQVQLGRLVRLHCKRMCVLGDRHVPPLREVETRKVEGFKYLRYLLLMQALEEVRRAHEDMETSAEGATRTCRRLEGIVSPLSESSSCVCMYMHGLRFADAVKVSSAHRGSEPLAVCLYIACDMPTLEWHRQHIQ